MEHQVDQFISMQREEVDYSGIRDREHRRDRDRRRDRSRERDRDYRRYRDRERGDKDDRRTYDKYSRSRERYSSPEPTGYEDSSGYLREEDRYPGFNPTYYPDYDPKRRDETEEAGYGDIDDRYDEYPRGRNGGRDRRAADKWITQDATNTIILRGLSQEIDEKDIRAELMMSNTPVKEVRLVKDKMTGASRGFAFVEFQCVGDAQQWMEQNQGQVYLLNKYHINIYYSTPKRDDRNSGMLHGDKSGTGGSLNPMMGVVGDWICSKCGVHNFKRREQCFKCNISREESDRGKEGDGYEQVGHNPCNTLVLRGLDALTTEENLTAALSKITALHLKNLYVARDLSNGVSRGYAFLEMNSIAESTQLLELINRMLVTFEVDGKAVIVNYAKNTYTTIMATLSSEYYARYPEQGQSSGYYDEEGKYYETSSNYYDYSQYYNSDGTPKAGAPATDTQTNTANAAAAVAQAAISKAQAAKAIQKHQESLQQELIKKIKDKDQSSNSQERMRHDAQKWAGTTQTTDMAEYVQYPEPDVSTYTYDESSGYYYDATTGLYYDASSQYYYNSSTSEFMYWDGEKKTYLPAPTDQQNALAEENKAHNTNKESKKDKVKVAKKIAKDMEKWAKTLNSQKDMQREAFKKMFQPLGAQQQNMKKEAATADAGFAILERSKHDQKLMPPPSFSGGKRTDKSPALVASYGENDSDNEETNDDNQDGKVNGVLDETKLADYTKMACLLCKRQFPNQEALERHQQLSDLHKKNLEQLRQAKGVSQQPSSNQEMDSVAMTIQYRDRAKERREKYGAPAPPVPKRSGQYTVPFEQTVSQNKALGSENKGSKLLQKMGWNEGQGLGKKGQGMIDPIQAARRTQGAGLGTVGAAASADIEDSDTYKEACKKVMLARFKDME